MKRAGSRVDCPKGQGLFSKFSRPNRYPRILTVGSRSGGMDLNGGDLILTMGSGSDGSSGFGRGAAAERAGILLPRRRVGKSSPDFSKLGAPASNRPELGSGRLITPCVIDLGPQRGLAGFRAVDSTAAAALSGQAHRRARILAPRAC